MHQRAKISRGFTLVELLVATAVFTIVMVIALGALLALSEANRKAEVLNAAVNNLNFTLDSMSRSIRTGSNYHCGVGGTLATPEDCSGTPESYIALLTAEGAKVAYCLDSGVIKRQIIEAGVSGSLSSSCSSSMFLPLTSPDVVVTNLSYYVLGAPLGDNIQPKVTILISAYVLTRASQKSTFSLQTSVTQRIYDL